MGNFHGRHNSVGDQILICGHRPQNTPAHTQMTFNPIYPLSLLNHKGENEMSKK